MDDKLTICARSLAITIYRHNTTTTFLVANYRGQRDARSERRGNSPFGAAK